MTSTDAIPPAELSPSEQGARASEALLLDIEGFEGPLDMLLMLARTQKVDLRHISVLALAEAYLSFIRHAEALRVELAADYLVMAAWLTYLKSRLLLPPEEVDDEPSGEDMAAHLAFQLERLEAMRTAAARLMARDQLGQDFFFRGHTEEMQSVTQRRYTTSLLDLMSAYARIRTRDEFAPLHVSLPPVYRMEQALERLRAVIGPALEWVDLMQFLPEAWRDDPQKRRSARAATFAASLELVKAGQAELRQEAVFSPIFLRKKEAGDG